MSMNEASYIIKNYEDRYIDNWNQTRYICYSIIQSQSTKSLKPTDVLKFPWEKDDDVPVKIPDENSKERLRNLASEIEKKLNING